MSNWLANQMLKLLGWKIIGQLPDTRKFVLVAAPHTSNWDFMYMYLVSKIFDIRIHWMGKEELFKGPMGPISRALGGIPVKRGHSMNMVQQMAQTFSEREELVLAVPPAGTRRKTDHWHSGFYYIAMEAGVPIVLGFVDYSRKQAGLGPIFTPTGNVRADMDIARDFYKDIQGKFPDNKSTVQLKQEMEQNRE
jgi:1-acyl-sn-glycerol-3-phosphate acyltransferase